jgi:hypothetical protein
MTVDVHLRQILEMNSNIEKLRSSVEPLKQAIIDHKLYSVIGNIEDVRTFMQHHVYAVWDFMSLLKSLQYNLTCTTIPWFPKGDAETRYLINEIVAGEESDVDPNGKRMSHFELYVQAMEQCGAQTEPIKNFISVLKESGNLLPAFEAASLPSTVRDFVTFTFHVIATDQPHLQAAVFCFGREDLIPEMFHSIVNDISEATPENISLFQYYLKRHIEVDGGLHGELALQMVAKLCGDNEEYWQQAEAVVRAALQFRVNLWNGIYDAIVATKN